MLKATALTRSSDASIPGRGSFVLIPLFFHPIISGVLHFFAAILSLF